MLLFLFVLLMLTYIFQDIAFKSGTRQQFDDFVETMFTFRVWAIGTYILSALFIQTMFYLFRR